MLEINMCNLSDMTRPATFQHQFVGEVVSLASEECHQDVTLLCQDGQVRANSFLLATVFPLVRRALMTVSHLEEDMVISLPGFQQNDFTTFLKSLSKQTLDVHSEENLKELTHISIQHQNTHHTIKDNIECKKEDKYGDKVDQEDDTDMDDVYLDDLDPLDNVKLEMKMEQDEEGNNEQDTEKKVRRYKRRYSNHINNPTVHGDQSGVSSDLVCQKCGYKCPTSRRSDFKKHLLSHEKQARKKEKMEKLLADNAEGCRVCGKTFTNPNKLLIHIKEVHEKPSLPCDICGKLLRGQNKLNRHRNTVHADESTKIYCKKCDKKYLPDYFAKHKCNWKEEPPKEVCNICGKTLGSASMANHIKSVHGDVEKKECHICGISMRASSLKDHLKTHEEKQCCPECGIKVRDIKVHMLRVHTSDDQKKFRCQDCGKGFISMPALENHRMNVHLKTYPHKCRYGCDVRYNDVNNRNSHERKKHGSVFKGPKQ